MQSQLSPVPVIRHARFRPVAVRDGIVLGGRGLELAGFDPMASCKRAIIRPAGVRPLLSKFNFTERLLRLSLYGVSFRSRDEALIIAGKSIWQVDLPGARLLSEFPVPGGRRPLNLLTTATGASYFGEYFGNPGREAVHLYKTLDGKTWSVCWKFEAGEIRHVHGLVYDSFRNGTWVLTGDNGDEAGLWLTTDGFETLVPIVRGMQCARAVTIIPTAQGLIVPTDTPQEPNAINFFDIVTGRFRMLCGLPGSSLSSTVDGDIMLVSTAVERSNVNRGQDICVFASINGETWTCILQLPRDWRFMRNMRPWFQHPTVYFPISDGSCERIFAWCRGVSGYDGHMISWSREELASVL